MYFTIQSLKTLSCSRYNKVDFVNNSIEFYNLMLLFFVQNHVYIYITLKFNIKYTLLI
jgi:hypothetical protein